MFNPKFYEFQGFQFFSSENRIFCEIKMRIIFLLCLILSCHLTLIGQTTCAYMPLIAPTVQFACIGDTLQLQATNVEFPNLDSGLVGFWPFDGNPTDQSSFGNGGTAVGATLTTDRFGQANSAYLFNGSSSIDVGTNGFPSGANTESTISAWFYLSSNSSSVSYLFCYGPTNPTNGSIFGIGKYGFGGAFGTYYGGACDVISGVSLPINSWHQLTVTQNSGNMNFYLDAVLIYSASGCTSNNVNPTSAKIGKATWNGDAWSGKIDDVRIWNRILSPTEINQVYFLGSQLQWSTGGTGDSITAIIDTTMSTIYLQSNNGIVSCSDSININISNLQLNFSLSPTDCSSNGNGSATVNPFGGIAPYSFNWSNGNTTNSNTNLLTGQYFLTVSDSLGCNFDTTVYIPVLDTIAPTVITQNLTVYLDAAGNASITAAQVDNGSFDNCAIDSLYLDIAAFTCADTSLNTVVLSAIDVNGNSNSAQATVTVLDTIAPTVLTQNLTVYLDAAGNASITAAEVDNGSFDNCIISEKVLSQTNFNCSHEGLNTVTYTVIDNSGNTSSTSLQVQVIDNLNSITGFTGENPAPTNSPRTYAVDSIAGASYNWSVTNGVINAQNGANASITWYNYTQGTVQIVQTTEFGCNDTLTQTIDLWPLGNIDITAQTPKVDIFPNPNRGEFTLKLESVGNENVQYTFSASDGRLIQLGEIQLEQGKFQSTFDFKNISQGVYFLQLVQEDGTRLTEKVFIR